MGDGHRLMEPVKHKQLGSIHTKSQSSKKGRPSNEGLAASSARLCELLPLSSPTLLHSQLIMYLEALLTLGCSHSLMSIFPPRRSHANREVILEQMCWNGHLNCAKMPLYPVGACGVIMLFHESLSVSFPSCGSYFVSVR